LEIADAQHTLPSAEEQEELKGQPYYSSYVLLAGEMVDEVEAALFPPKCQPNAQEPAEAERLEQVGGVLQLLEHHYSRLSYNLLSATGDNITVPLIAMSDLTYLNKKLSLFVDSLNSRLQPPPPQPYQPNKAAAGQVVGERWKSAAQVVAQSARALRVSSGYILEATVEAVDTWVSTHWSDLLPDKELFLVKDVLGSPEGQGQEEQELVSEWAQSLFREFLAGSFAASAHLDPASRRSVFPVVVTVILDSFLETLLLNKFKINRQGARILQNDVTFLKSSLRELTEEADEDLWETMSELTVFKRLGAIVAVLRSPERASPSHPDYAKTVQMLPDLEGWSELVSQKHLKKFKKWEQGQHIRQSSPRKVRKNQVAPEAKADSEADE